MKCKKKKKEKEKWKNRKIMGKKLNDCNIQY